VKKFGVLSKWFAAGALVACMSAVAHGQAVVEHNTRVLDSIASKPPFVPHYYHLTYVVKELEAGKVINSRSYDLSIGTLENTTNNSYNNRSIRTGTKVPISDDKGNVSYVDVGIKFDCKNLVVLGDRLALDVSAEISSIQNDTADNHPPIQIAGRTQNFVTSLTPVIQQNTWNSQVMVVLGKPTVLFSSDEVTSKRTMQLELTATEIK